MTEKTKGKKKNKAVSVLIRILIVIFIMLLFAAAGIGILYVADAQRLETEFGSNIWVNEKRVGGKTPEQVSEIFLEEFAEKTLVVKEGDEGSWEGTLIKAGYSIDREKLVSDLKDIMVRQTPGFSFTKEREDYHIDFKVNLDEEIFRQQISESSMEGERTDPVNAYVQYDEEQKKFIIVPEVMGTHLIDENIQAIVRSALESEFEAQEFPEVSEVALDDTCYVVPEINSQDPGLNEQVNILNSEIDKYKNTTVTYLFGETKEVITSDMICSWIVVENNQVSLPEEPVRQYVKDLAAKYNTMYRERTITTTDGQNIKMPHNEYGYLINTEEEFKQLYQDLSSGQAVEREPIYTKAGYKRNGKDDLAGCYIEVSLEKQHLWLYKDGKLVTETDVVTGLPTPERETLKGAWSISYKASPYKLSSDEYGYNVEVQYWMPFVYGQGLHDASWKHKFGGEEYKTSGSHGCVNLPPDQAKIIYETITKGYAVLIY